MRYHGYQDYFDNQVLAASPMQLIEMLYDAALDSIAEARRHIRRKDILARVRAINKALRIVSELSRCLNHEAAADLSRTLAALYGYVMRLLVQANAKQIELPLAEAEGLMSTLAEAWKASTPNVRESDFSSTDLLPKDAYVVGEAAPTGP